MRIMDENGLEKLEASEIGIKVRRVENLKQSMEEIGWMGVGVEELGRLSNGEAVQKLRDYLKGGEGELGGSSRATLQAEGAGEMMKSQCKTKCVDIGCKRIWRVLTN